MYGHIFLERLAALRSSATNSAHNSLAANCTTIFVPVHSQFSTNQSGLTYTLSSVDISGADNTTTPQPTLPYLNQPLQDCNVFLIQIDVSELDRTLNQVITSSWGSTVRALATCQVYDRWSTYQLSLSATYDLVPAAYSGLTGPLQIVAMNRTERASLWWGESLLSAYWVNVSSTLAQAQYSDEFATPFMKGFFEWLSHDEPANISNVDAFDMTFNIVPDGDNVGNFKDKHVGSIWEPGSRFRPRRS